MAIVTSRRSTRALTLGGLLALLPVGVAVAATTPPAGATTPASVNLGSAAAASVLAGTTVTSTGQTVLGEDLDVSPGSAETGFPAGTVDGTEHLGDVVAGQAQSDLMTAYNAAAGAPVTDDVTGVDLSGKTLGPGVYNATAGMTLTGSTPLTLDGDASSVWILQAGSTLVTAAGTSVRLTGGAQACNVFWQVGSSATLAANSSFAGNILASASITIGAGSTLDGRALAHTGAVTLANNRITAPECATTIPSVTVRSSVADATLAPVTLTADVSPADATGSVTFNDLVSSGPQAGQTVVVGTGILAGGSASVTVSLPAFGSNIITADYGGDSTYAAATSPAVGVSVNAYEGEVIINQFRLSGLQGTRDTYVELYNNGPAVPLAGFVLGTGSDLTVTLPTTAPTLPTGHSYLIGGERYSLGNVARADLTVATDAAAGLQLIAPDEAGTVVDAVGFTGDASGFFSGTPLPALAGTPTEQYAWVRREVAGVPIDAGDNANDFDLVATTGGPVGGIQSMLGTPTPLASGSPVQDNANLGSSLLDPDAPSSTGANLTYLPGSPGTLTVRRTITNTGDSTVTSAEIRITALSETNGDPEPGVVTQPANPARLRLIDPVTPVSSVLVGAHDVSVEDLSPDAPADPTAGAGIDTTLSIPLAGGMAPGVSISVALTFAVDRGGRYWFGYDVDALTGSTSTDRSHRASSELAKGRPKVRAAAMEREDVHLASLQEDGTTGGMSPRPSRPRRRAHGLGGTQGP